MDCLITSNRHGTPPAPPTLIQRLLNLLGASRGTPPPHINMPVTTLFPDFTDRDFGMNTFTTPHSRGEVDIPVKPRGRWSQWLAGKYDPRKNVDSDYDRRISLWYHERNQTGLSAGAVATMPFIGLNSAFKTNSDAQITNIGIKEPGQSRYISDVIEASMADINAYDLNEEQKEWVGKIKKFYQDAAVLERKYGLLHENEENNGENPVTEGQRDRPYMTRIVTTRPEGEESIKPRRSGIGAKPGFTKERLFETEAEGVEAGFKYEPDIETRLRVFSQRLYRAIADNRFLNDPIMTGKMVKRTVVESALRQQYYPRVKNGEWTMDQMEQAISNQLSQRQVNLPGRTSLVFELTEDANAINDLVRKQTEIRKSVLDMANNVLRTTMLTGDLSAFGVQLQALMSPASMPAYAKALLTTFKTLAKPGNLRAYSVENWPLIQEYMLMGGTLGGAVDQAAGLERDQLFAKLRSRPVREVLSKLQFAFMTPIDVAKLEFYRSARLGAETKQLPGVVEQVDNLFGTARTTGIGISPAQNLFERKALFAPRYYRSAVNNIAAIMTLRPGGPSTKLVWEALGNVSTSALFAFYAIAVAAGMEDEEIERRLNPFNITNQQSPFLSVDVQVGDSSYTMGIGGVYFSLLRLSQRIVRTFGEDPSRLFSLSPSKNPMLRWAVGHVSPAIGAASSVVKGETYQGEELTWMSFLGGFGPISAQEAMREGPAAGGASFFGYNAWRHSEKARYMKDVEADAKSTFGKSYKELSLDQMASIVKKLAKDPKYARDPNQPFTPRQRQSFIAAQDARKKSLRRLVDQDIVAAMDSMGLSIQSYDNTVTRKGVDVPLPRELQKVYESLVASEYNDRLPDLINRSSFQRMKRDKQQELANDTMALARKIARRELLKMSKQ